jgi:hypothetical protein
MKQIDGDNSTSAHATVVRGVHRDSPLLGSDLHKCLQFFAGESRPACISTEWGELLQNVQVDQAAVDHGQAVSANNDVARILQSLDGWLQELNPSCTQSFAT